MSLFDVLVEQAMRSEGALGLVRPAVEKELLHHDILREMNRSDLLRGLTFIGGTCLRACYGSSRLSEDLDFTGGNGFEADQLSTLGRVLEHTLMEKYGLPVTVSAPIREAGNTSTWKLKIQTRPASKHLPSQRINIDICALPSHQTQPALLMNKYGVDMGTDGLIIQVETKEEILVDKWVALALRPNRVKYRDLWDILWLARQGCRLDNTLFHQKLADRKIEFHFFANLLSQRMSDLKAANEHQKSFRNEMERFVFASDQRTALGNPDYWHVLMLHLQEQQRLLAQAI